jgi:hypothetical protein
LRCSTCARDEWSGARFHHRQVEDVTAPQLVARVLEDLYGDEPRWVSEAGVGTEEPEDLDVCEEWLATSAARVQVGCRSAATSELQETVTQRQGGVHPPSAAAGVRPQQSGQGAQRVAGLFDLPSAVAHRVLRHGPLPGSDYVGSMVVLKTGCPGRRVPTVR